MIAVRGATKSCPVKCEQQVPERQKLVHTHRTSCRHDWPRGFGALNSSLHSWIFTSVLVGSNPRYYLSTSPTVWIPVHTTPKSGTERIRYVTLHFRDGCGAASLRHKNRAATTVLVCEKTPYPIWFSWRRESYPLLCEHRLKRPEFRQFSLLRPVG